MWGGDRLSDFRQESDPWHFYGCMRRGAQEASWGPAWASSLPSPLPHRISPLQFVQVAEPHPHMPGGIQKIPDRSRTRGGRDLQSLGIGAEAPQPTSEVAKQPACLPSLLQGVLQEGPHSVWRLRTSSAEPPPLPLPSTPDLSWVSYAMLSSKVGRAAACPTTGQGLWASWRCV